MALVHHVCKETAGLQSLFLISKSNCAFANFKEEQTCVAAQQKLHDSRFQSVRLVCRLRKSTVQGSSGVTAPTGPAASIAQQPSASETAPEIPGKDPGEISPSLEDTFTETRLDSSLVADPEKDRFFILKSLTVEDLESSMRTGIWATQQHNEETLNTAFRVSGVSECRFWDVNHGSNTDYTQDGNVDNVYLVFSANKSGEYFGYARMMSPIDEDPASAIEFAPKLQASCSLDLPQAIPTEATEFAPKGRIIDDSARGTIFWEADRDGNSGESSAPDSEAGSTGEGEGVGSTNDDQEGVDFKAWGKPFKLEWLSTTKLPFYRTRGLRNPWNSNREVKIARDGTELEPSVGRKLIGLFNRVPVTPSGVAGRQAGLNMPGYPPGRPLH